MRILLWPWCGPLSISNKSFSIGIKTINHTPSTSFTRRRDGCVCQKLVRASCSRLMCLPIRPCQPLRSWQSSLIRNPWPRFFCSSPRCTTDSCMDRRAAALCRTLGEQHAVCCFETHAFAHRTFGGSIRCSFRGRASNRPALKPVPVPSAFT